MDKRWEMVRPGVARLVYNNGSFFMEYHMDGRRALGVSRGGTVEFSIDEIEQEMRALAAQGITSATVAK